MLGFLKSAGKIAGGLIGLGGGSIDYAKLANALGAGGAAVGAGANAAAHNRGAEFDGRIALEREIGQRDRDYWDQVVQREQEGRASQGDAWRKLMAAQRMANPGPRPQLSPYSVAPRQATGAELQGADALTQEVMARLQNGNALPQVERRTLTIDPTLLKPGTAERVGGWLSPILSFLGAGQRQPAPQGVMYTNNAPSGITPPPRRA